MINLEVTVFLNTPLHQVDVPDSTRDVIVWLEGKILHQDASGMLIHVKSVGTERKGQEKTVNFKKVFLPMHKIDFVRID